MQVPFLHPPDTRLELRTKRLVLRPTRTDDAPLLWPHVADHEMTRYMTWDPHRDEQETKTFLETTVNARLKAHGVTWLILEDGLFRGICALDGVQRQVLGVRVDKAELGYWIRRDQHGRGLMTEAAGAVVACGFRDLGLHKVWTRVMEPNAPSRRVIEKLGFSPVGRQRRELERRGKREDVLLFEMLADEPAAARLRAAHP